ncbi:MULTISPECIES: hypothetical protein [unclassified Sphingomonas]|uniref:hypothetical protein n=1 Tax=unclassified Sphingomonas TaxID=196159 RepID=UPI0006F6C565|nr:MULTISPECIES: hypothetical protein [unclassified Sphingomonas]KQX21567.1 hypothetical protein ASD17_06320 [Sphingomonas sp. Root1294]KQY72884.1 hypothetical protein ASD39_00305 [Sphingomonas sp. Root50]KRB88323.1 hypothetical protein ASE22_23135 [Sphingomonas sp. Root720]
MTPDPDDLRAARAAAAKLLAQQGYHREAAMVLAGEGDDFSEVRTALALLGILAAGAASPPSQPAKLRNGRRLAGEEC